MEEINKTNRLTILVIAFVLVIIIGLITLRRPEIKYELSPTESLALLNDTALICTPGQVAGMLADSSGKVVFVDVRNSIAFNRGHVKNAINIPVRELFTPKNRTIFKDLEKASQKAVLYGESQLQANGPWLMLQQTGYKNILVFTGSYAQLNLNPSDSLYRLLPLLSETPLIDTAALNALTAPTAKAVTAPEKPAKKIVVPVKKAVTSGGGC